MSPSARRLVPLLCALALVLSVAAPVLADASLVRSTPDDKAVLATPPGAVTLRFSEGLDGGKSSFRLVGPGGEVGTGRPTRDGGRVMSLADLDLGPGAYTVKWVVGSEDGHLVRGTVRFTVLEPTPVPATPSPVPTEAASADASEEPPATPSAAPPTALATPVEPTRPAASEDPGEDLDPVATTGSGTDILVVIVAALALVGGMGAWILRRNRVA